MSSVKDCWTLLDNLRHNDASELKQLWDSIEDNADEINRESESVE